ncbi:MAG: hypothetical protein AAGF74_06965 [Pseudomonadota bacterium]
MRDIRMAFLVAVAASALTGAILRAGVGFDDANITMNYAENIAHGHGYVYFVGGERVEGSTSALWTAINTLAFSLFGRAEVFLALLGFCLGAGTVLVTMRIARHIADLAGHDGGAAAAAACLTFLAFPTFWGWAVWSYMDVTLWVFLNALAFLLLLKLPASSGSRSTAGFIAVLVLVAFCRPEGVAAGLGFSGLAVLLVWGDDAWRALRTGAVSGLAVLVAVGALTALRLSYFGVPVPNTFYAKVSTSYLDQLAYGFYYVWTFLFHPLNAVLVLGFLAALPVGLRTGGGFLRAFLAALALVLAGAAMYAVLGGDHFGGHRFLQMFLPLMIPFAILPVLSALGWVDARLSGRLPVHAVAAGLAILAAWSAYIRNGGYLWRELLIAREGREVGQRLNAYPGTPSVGIVAAGGISMTYDGPIYDLMGLNWTKMAMAGRDHTGRPKNHGGFDRDVFFEELPALIAPALGGCDKEAVQSRRTLEIVLQDLLRDPRFTSLYEFECLNDVGFFRLKDLPSPQDG